MVKIVGISGSLRVGSHNTILLDAASRLLDPSVEYSTASIDLPLYTGNNPNGVFPDSVSVLREQVRNADALIITTPEYNWSMTAALKNAIDWLSIGGKDSPLNDHVAALAGVGGGRLGSVRAQMSVRNVLLHNRVWVIPGPEVLIAPSDDNFDAECNLTDPFAKELLQTVLDELVRITPLLRKRK